MRRTEKKLGYFQNHQNWTAEILLYANLFDLKTSIVLDSTNKPAIIKFLLVIWGVLKVP